MARRRRTLAVMACVVMGFVVVLAVRSRPASPQTRLPRQYQLAALIERERNTTADLQSQVQDLRARVDQLRAAANSSRLSSEALEQRVATVSAAAGLAAMKGPGL